jgi:hypothetical protein
LEYSAIHVSVPKNARRRAKGSPGCFRDSYRQFFIDYLDPNGVTQQVEVKGTIAAAFTGVDMTANEIEAARVHGQNYWLYLVAGCLTDAPRVQTIQNPASKLSAGEWSATPTLFALKFGGYPPRW